MMLFRDAIIARIYREVSIMSNINPKLMLRTLKIWSQVGLAFLFLLKSARRVSILIFSSSAEDHAFKGALDSWPDVPQGVTGKRTSGGTYTAGPGVESRRAMLMDLSGCVASWHLFVYTRSKKRMV